MPLTVIVVGAGIAGLTAATALCQAGHSVQIFEKSSFKTEVGAALNLLPNGAFALKRLGFDFKRALVRRHATLETINGIDLASLTRIDLSDVEEKYGGHMQSVLRADLHSELLRLSQLAPNPATLRLGSPIKSVNATEGVVVLESGEIHTADLIVAADGAHSICRTKVLGFDHPPIESGNYAFRFLIPTSDIEDLENTRDMIPGRLSGASIFADIQDKFKTRHLAWYECHGGKLQNFVGIYPASQHVQGVDNRLQLLSQFKHFHPRIVEILKLADDVKVWPLRFDDPLPQYTRGRLMLVGDAAHTMLPFSGQGANLAIEESQLLGEFFMNASPAEVPDGVRRFEATRRKRIVTIKLLSRIRFGKENDAAYRLLEHDELDSTEIPRSFHERLLFEWKNNSYGEAKKLGGQ